MSIIYLPIESYLVDVLYESKGGYVLRIGNYYALYKDSIEYVTDNEILANLLLYEKSLEKPRKLAYRVSRLPMIRLTREAEIYNSGEMLIEGRVDLNKVKIIREKDLENHAFDLITYEWENNVLRSQGDKVFTISFERCDLIAEKNGTEIYECYTQEFGKFLVLNHVFNSVIAQSINVLIKLGQYALNIDEEVLESLKSIYMERKERRNSVYNVI